MDKQNRITVNEKNNVVSMALDANFFFERAMRHIDQHNYSKALKYLWKTIEFDSNNPLHYCNLAGVLSEIGRFEESSRLLLYVIEKIDPNLSECYFYLASNYTYLEDLESSYHYIKYYLELAPNGEYVDEAQEMLEYLTFELEISEEQRENGNMQLLIWHRQAKRSIEDGKYRDAIKQLLEILAISSEFIAARNNLSLAYFYIGNINKAIEQAQLVLERDQTNIHSLANLAIYYHHLQDQVLYERSILCLKKIVPLHREGLYKLATTFGILGEDAFAFQHLRRLIKEGIPDSMVLHYGAISALNTNHYDIAEKWWRQLLFTNHSKVAEFYLELLTWGREQSDVDLPNFPYHQQIPFVDWIHQIEEDPKLYKSYPFYSFVFPLGLKYGDDTIKEHILALLYYLDKKNSEAILRQVLLEEGHSYSLKRKSMMILEIMNAVTPYILKRNNKITEFNRVTPAEKNWKPVWLKVLKTIKEEMAGRYNSLEILHAQELWFDFIARTVPNTPQIRKAEGWAAAIEYVVSHLKETPMTIEKLGVHYQVSDLTIVKNIKRFQEVLSPAYDSEGINQFE